MASFNWGTDVKLLKSYIRDELASMFPSVNFDSMVFTFTQTKKAVAAVVFLQQVELVSLCLSL